MKSMMILATTFFTAIAAHPQTPPNDWSWTFQRGGETCGLLFEDINLITSVKAAIRDDVVRVYSTVNITDTFTRLYTPEDMGHGTFIGFYGFLSDGGCPKGLGGWHYKLHNGNKYFHVEKGLSNKYLEKISLTNQHQAAAGSLSNFLATVNSVTTNNAVMSEYLTYWWVSRQNRMLTMDDFPMPGDFLDFIMPYCEEELLAPSILNFKHGEGELNGELCYEMVSRNRYDGYYKRSAYGLVFKNGQWRIVLPFY